MSATKILQHKGCACKFPDLVICEQTCLYRNGITCQNGAIFKFSVADQSNTVYDFNQFIVISFLF